MNWFQRLFKKKRHFTKTVTCPICDRTVPQKGNMKTCGSKECKSLWKRGQYALKHSPSDGAGSVPPGSALEIIPLMSKLEAKIDKDEGSYPAGRGIVSHAALKVVDPNHQVVNLPSVFNNPDVNLHGKLTTSEVDDLWEKK